MTRLTALARVAVATLALCAAACAPDGRVGDEAVLGALYPLSGQQGPGGAEEAAGARLAVELANERGGLAGRPLRLDAIDVAVADAAPAAIDRLHRRGVDVVLGTYGSTISAAAASAAARRGMVLWETGAVGMTPPDAEGGRSFFRLAPQGANLGRAAVAFVRDQLAGQLGAEPLRYAVAYVDDPYGRAVAFGALEEAEVSGELVVGRFPYAAAGFDANALADRVALSRPDVLFVSAYLEDGIALRRATVERGVALKASIGTSSSYCMPAFAAALGPAAVGLFASDKPDGELRADAALEPGAREVLDWARARWAQTHGGVMTPAGLAGFANTWALVGHVLPAAGATSPAEVRRAALAARLAPGALPNGAGLDLAGPDQPDAGENRAAVSVIWQWLTPQRHVVVWPPAFAEAPVRAMPILP